MPKRFLLILVLIAVALFAVVGGLSFLKQKGVAPPRLIPEVDQTTRELKSQGVSDEIVDIETDLENTDLTQLDKELLEIEAELSF